MAGQRWGVVFDMDGVLVDSAEAHFESFMRLVAEYGRSISREEFAKLFGRQNRDIMPALFGPLSEAEIEARSDRKEALYRDLVRGNLPAIPGAVDLVRALQAADVRMAIGSSGPRANVELIIQELGIGDALCGYVCSEDVRRGKPHPDVFVEAARRLDLPPARCVVIEDAPHGIEAAHAAGARAVAILIHQPREAFPNPDLAVDALAELTVEQLHALVPDA
jgi:beta-phosphoglucomutase